MYDSDSDDEINGDLRMAEYYDNIDNDNGQHILREKGRPIINTNKNKPSSLTVNKSSLKETHTKKINQEDNDEKMDTSVYCTSRKPHTRLTIFGYLTSDFEI